MSRPILVIKLGALGDFVQAFGPFAAIRAHHPGAEITLLTTGPFEGLARACPWFDRVWLDERPKAWQPLKWLSLRRRLRSGGFGRVYDLQTSDRSSGYFRLMGGNVEWSGIAQGCSHPHANPQRDFMHTVERQREQLTMAGLTLFPAPDLSWTEGSVGRFGLTGPYVLLCPGGAAHRPAKRWPVERFAALGNWLVGRGLVPVLLGSGSETPILGAITALCPTAINLAGKTSMLDLLALGRGAVAAVGNDTGPMHAIAISGRPAVVLFSHESDPALCAPRGQVTVLRRTELGELPAEDVETALTRMVGP